MNIIQCASLMRSSPHTRWFIKTVPSIDTFQDAYRSNQQSEDMDPRLEHLERLDRWLLSRGKWELRGIALLIALVLNVPIAWAESRLEVDPSTISSPAF